MYPGWCGRGGTGRVLYRVLTMVLAEASLRLIYGILLLSRFIRPFDWEYDLIYWFLRLVLDLVLDLSLDLVLDLSLDLSLDLVLDLVLGLRAGLRLVLRSTSRISNLRYTGFKGLSFASDILSLRRPRIG